MCFTKSKKQKTNSRVVQLFWKHETETKLTADCTREEKLSNTLSFKPVRFSLICELDLKKNNCVFTAGQSLKPYLRHLYGEFTLWRGNQANKRALWEGHVSIELVTSQGNTINPLTDHNWISMAESSHSDIILIQFLKSPGHISLRVS